MVTTVTLPDEGQKNTATIARMLTQHSISSSSEAAQRTGGGRRLANSGKQTNTNNDNSYLGIGNGNSTNESPFIHQQSSLYLDEVDNHSAGGPLTGTWPVGKISLGGINNNYILTPPAPEG